MFKQIKNILLYLDFSKNSKNAIEYAIKFFKMMRAISISSMFKSHQSM